MKRSRRILLYTGFFLALLLGTTWVVLTQTGLTRSYIREILREFVKGGFKIGDAELNPLDVRITITDVEITDNGRDFLKIPKAEIDISTNPFGRVGEVRTIRAENIELDLYLGEEQAFDLGNIFNLRRSEDPQATPRLPAIEVTNMTIRLHFFDDKEKDLVLTLGPTQLSALPDSDEEGRHIIRGSCPNPFGGSIVVEGVAHAERNEFRLFVKADQFPIDADKVEPFSAAAAEFIRKHEITGLIAPTLWLTYPDEENRLLGGIVAKLDDFTIRPPTFTYKLDHMRGTAAFSLDDNGTLQIDAEYTGTDIEHLRGKIRLENIAGTDELKLEISVKKLLIDSKLRAAVANIPAAKRIFDAFDFDSGRADAEIYIHTGVRAKATPQDPIALVQLDIDLHRVGFQFHGFPPADGNRRISFPYPLIARSGKIIVRDSYVKIQDLLAEHEAGGRIRASGELDFSGPSAARHWVKLLIRGEELPLGAALRKAVATVIGQADLLEKKETIWDQFQPEGSVDLLFRLEKASGEEEFRFDTEIDPRSISATWRKFPYRMTSVLGRIHIVSNVVSFDLQGRRDFGMALPVTIKLRGRFSLDGQPGGEPKSGELHIEADNLPINEELHAALAVKFDKELVDRQWKAFSPQGMLNLELLAWKVPGEEDMNFDLSADLSEGKFAYDRFPAQIVGAKGRIVVHGDQRSSRLELLGIEGRLLGGNAFFHGRMDFIKARNGSETDIDADLSIVARGIQVGEELEGILAETKLLESSVWDMAKPSGTIDVVQRIVKRQGELEYKKDLWIDIRDLRSEAAMLPAVLSKGSGEIHIDPDQILHIKNVEAYIGEARIQCDEGVIRSNDKHTIIELNLNASHYPIDERLARLLTGEIKTAYLARKAHGEVSFSNLGITMIVPKKKPDDGTLGLDIRFKAGATLRAHNLSLDAGMRLSDIEGVLTLGTGHFNEAGAVFNANMSGIAFVAFGQQFKDARGHLRSTKEQFTIANDASFLVHGGKITGRNSNPKRPLFLYLLNEKRHMELHVRLADIKLESLMRDFAGTDRSFRGHCWGDVDLSVDAVDLASLAMTCDLGVGGEKAYLGTVPIFRSIYQLMDPKRRPAFNFANCKVKTEGRKFKIESFQAKSPILEVEGEGELSYDGYLKLTVKFPNLFPGAPILSEFLNLPLKLLVDYEVYGYIGDIRSSPRFLIQKGKLNERMPLEPNPGRASRIPPVFK